MTPNLLDELEGVVRLMDVANAADIFDTFDAVDDFQAAAVNFLRAHAPALADMERDAARYRWLRDKAHEEHRITTIGIYIKWGASYELGSIGGADADDEIDDAMAIDATREGAG